MPDEQKNLLKSGETATFFESLGMLLQAGVPANECPGIIAEDMKGSHLGAMAEKLNKLLTQGEIYILSEAMEKTGIFPAYSVEMVRLGEDSGRLEASANSLGGYYRRQQSLEQSIRSAISGPLMLLIVMGVVLFFLLVFVLPVFEGVFESLGLAGGGDIGGAFAAARVAMIVVAVLLALVLAGVVMYLVPGWRKKLVEIAEYFPATRRVHYALSASRFTHGLEMMLASGIPVAEAVDKAGALVTNKRITEKLPACRQAVESGEDLGKALVDTEVLDDFEAKILLSASRAGQTETAMRRLSEAYSEEADAGIDRLLGTIEPALVGILSVAIGVILLSVMLPLAGIMGAIT